jgi:hypothetical protein
MMTTRVTERTETDMFTRTAMRASQDIIELSVHRCFSGRRRAMNLFRWLYITKTNRPLARTEPSETIEFKQSLVLPRKVRLFKRHLREE